MELALIEIDPSQPVLHALAWAGPPGTGTAVGAINQRLRDLETGEVIATSRIAICRMPGLSTSLV